MFKVEVPGKFILSGEHAVLRGCPAVVFPLNSKKFSLVFQPSDRPLSLKKNQLEGADLDLVFWGLIERALQLAGKTREEIKGEVTIQSTIPPGTGLGASAALCVAVGRWFSSMKWVEESQLPEFCRQLENLFHGESSGVDVAVVLANRPILYVRGEGAQFFEPTWQPEWRLSYSGRRSSTAESVARVKEMFERSKKKAERLDEQMRRSSSLMLEALKSKPEPGFLLLVEAMELAKSCFREWGLTSGELDSHMMFVENLGARAVKPTGSGGGGFVLSLWEEAPPVNQASLSPT